VCRVNKTDKYVFLEVTFPSGFAFAEIFHKPYDLKNKLDDDKTRLENIYLSNKGTHLFHVSDPLFLSLGNCWNVLAYRKVNVSFDTSNSNQRSFGWVAIHSVTDYKKTSLKYFYL